MNVSIYVHVETEVARSRALNSHTASFPPLPLPYESHHLLASHAFRHVLNLTSQGWLTPGDFKPGSRAHEVWTHQLVVCLPPTVISAHAFLWVTGGDNPERGADWGPVDTNDDEVAMVCNIAVSTGVFCMDDARMFSDTFFLHLLRRFFSCSFLSQHVSPSAFLQCKCITLMVCMTRRDDDLCRYRGCRAQAGAESARAVRG